MLFYFAEKERGYGKLYLNQLFAVIGANHYLLLGGWSAFLLQVLVYFHCMDYVLGFLGCQQRHGELTVHPGFKRDCQKGNHPVIG